MIVCIFLAADSVKFVYRLDSRDPSEIFYKGFASRGNNNVLMAHIMGHSIYETKDSAFVSTAVNLDGIQAYARHAAGQLGQYEDIWYMVVYH